MEKQTTDWCEEIPRMVALAERFAAEGQMNLNKLLEAAVYAQIRRAAWHYSPEVTTGRMQAELAVSLQFLKQDGIATELVGALEKGYQGLIEQRSTDLPLSDAPDVFICRTCGHLAMNAAPERCPDCASWPGRFRKFVAFFNGDNAEPINPLEVIRLFAYNAEQLERLVIGLSEEQLIQKPAKNEWSIRDHVAHFYDAQEMLDTRLDLMINYDDPELSAVAIYEYATEEKARPATTGNMLAEFLDQRARSIAQLESLPLKDLWRTGRHTEFGQITILRQVAYLAFHEQTHLPEIEALRNMHI